MIELVGWISTITFSLCAVPQAYQSYKQKHSNGLSVLTLLLWFTGESCAIIYVSLTTGDVILLTNYVFNLSFLLIIMYYKYVGEYK
jgi:uncharacterized protein with PQ loop repeat